MATDADLADVLRTGELHVLGRMVDASNLAVLCEVRDAPGTRCIYKPVRGERALWDFPDVALAHREVAMYELAEWVVPSLVPPTVWREDGPLGPGMCQSFIADASPSEVVSIIDGHITPDGWITILEAQDSTGAPVSLVHRNDPALRVVALLDAIANNADRKGGHLLTDPSGRLCAIDHGVTFHVEPKLRTVLWGWAGERLLPEEIALLDRVISQWPTHIAPTLGAHLSALEIDMAFERAVALRAGGVMPVPHDEWPSLPWPVL